MPKMLILQGLPASGKSTYAKEWVNQDPKHRVRINRDTMRLMLNPIYSMDHENLVTDILDFALNNILAHNYDVVIDNMNLSKKYVDDLEAKAKEANYEIVIKSFKDVPLDVCIERDSKRELSIGKSVITALHKKYLA